MAPARNNSTKFLPWAYALPAIIISFGFWFGVPWLVSRGVDSFTAFVISALPWFVVTGAHVWRGGLRDKKWKLTNLTPLHEPLPGLKTIPLWLGAIVLMFLLYGLGEYLFGFLSTIVQQHLPSWHFENKETQRLLADTLSERSNVQLIALLISTNIFIGLIMPMLEELYFTGMLLPSVLDRFGKAGILLHTVLFSAYHLFSIWLLPIRILSIWPMFILAHRYRSVKLSMLIHCGLNTIGASGLTFEILKNIFS